LGHATAGHDEFRDMRSVSGLVSYSMVRTKDGAFDLFAGDHAIFFLS
jgi:hypothetical protein